MPRATKAQSEATAARIVLTARRLFTERGYAGVGLEEIAAQAGVTRGAVYHHFAGKTALFEAVLAQVQTSVATAIERDVVAVDGAWARLEVGCRTFLAASAGEEARRIMLIDAPAVLGWSAWRAHDAASSRRLLEDVLGELAAAGEMRATSPGATAALLSGAMNEAALWIAGASDRDRATDEAWEQLSRMLSALRA